MNADDLKKALNRREFLASAAGIGAGLALVTPGRAQTTTGTATMAVHPGGSDKIRVGLIGSGGRGTGAALDCIRSSENVEIVAMCDAFEDFLKKGRDKLTKEAGDKMKVTDDTAFFGLDSYQKVLASECNLVILATPPGFRPIHFEAAINAGKNVFMEKPIAVDPVGVRKVLAASDVAKEKGLAVVAGTQRRHNPAYIEIVKRIHDGQLGELTGGACYWCQEGLWNRERKPGMSDMEWQVRNWLYFDWLSGDHIVEQHLHNIDIMNWVFGGPPKSALGTGGRQTRTDEIYGNIYDHFAIEFEYPNGARVMSLSRQQDGTSTRVSEFVSGALGFADPSEWIKGKNAFKYEPAGEPVNPYVQEHADLIKSIRSGNPLNEGRQVAESTLTAIMGRTAAYTGRQVTYKWLLNSSKQDLTPPHYELKELAINPVPQPGKTQLV